MTFTKKDLRLVSVRPYTKKKDDGTERLLYFVKVADKQSYDTDEFMVSASQNKPETLVAGNDYDLELIAEKGSKGHFLTVILEPAEKAGKFA